MGLFEGIEDAKLSGPEYTPQGPAVMGRHDDDYLNERTASSDSVKQYTVAWNGAIPNGMMKAELFRSNGCMDECGAVLRLTGSGDGAFIPWARVVDGGVEIHIAGEEESASFLAALRLLLEQK